MWNALDAMFDALGALGLLDLLAHLWRPALCVAAAVGLVVLAPGEAANDTVVVAGLIGAAAGTVWHRRRRAG